MSRTFLLLLVILAGCQKPDANAPPKLGDELTGPFEGRYLSSFEISSFTPCQFPEERWWVATNLEPVENFIRASGRDPIRQQTTVYVRWSGRATPLGRYGHMGGYQREFTIENVEEVREVVPSDCPPSE